MPDIDHQTTIRRPVSPFHLYLPQVGPAMMSSQLFIEITPKRLRIAITLVGISQNAVALR